VRAVTVEEDGGADPTKAKSIWVAVDRVDDDSFSGTVVYGGIDEVGYRNGDTITAPKDRIWDLSQIGDHGRPELNADRALSMVGKTVLIGITEKSPEFGVRQSQVVGMIQTIDDNGIRLQLQDGTDYVLPPDVRSFEDAWPGEYRLRSTGEVIVNPDFTTNWVSERP
jgi:hypothetical protein